MIYPYVPAWYDDLGRRKGPTLGLMYHMAEGGGTVGYLDDKGTAPPRGVSVHAVCEYSGRVVRMLDWRDASGSLNPANRSTDKAYFGHSHLVDVLGDWWRDPNSAVISMEIEGFARTGPNPAQTHAAIAWGLDMRSMFPDIRGALGHADQTDTKGCPGATGPMRLIFEGVGGHGLFAEVAMKLTDVRALAGTATLKVDGPVWRVADDARIEAKAGATWSVVGTVRYHHTATDPTGDPGYMIRARASDGELHVVAISRCMFTPAAPVECGPAIAADRAKARIVWADGL